MTGWLQKHPIYLFEGPSTTTQKPAYQIRMRSICTRTQVSEGFSLGVCESRGVGGGDPHGYIGLFTHDMEERGGSGISDLTQQTDLWSVLWE